ncbi:hypothetical protein CEJ86_32395 [Sinorhizobium meliloti]|uniref:Uncharacterized protein n=1 Tax=Rhizobium meliloti TaxID=382 RepID=A0A2J0YT66_RHIML|nr:hypothetical protein CEJ86_32395 [Sinorhizobium meliloti]
MTSLTKLMCSVTVLAGAILGVPTLASAGGGYYEGISTKRVNVGHNKDTKAARAGAKVVVNRPFPKRGAYYKGIFRNGEMR